MGAIAIAVLFGLVLAGLALRANERFRGEERLPMQWLLTGEVTWSAPRGVALAFIPVLAVVVLAACVVLILNVPVRTGQEHLILPALTAMGAIFVACQLLHCG